MKIQYYSAQRRACWETAVLCALLAHRSQVDSDKGQWVKRMQRALSYYANWDHLLKMEPHHEAARQGRFSALERVKDSGTGQVEKSAHRRHLCSLAQA